MFRLPLIHFRIRKNELLHLNDIHFDLKKGETLGVVGRTGAGKNDFIKMFNP